MKVLFAQTFNLGVIAVMLFVIGVNLKRRFLIRALETEADLRQEPELVDEFLLTGLLEPDLEFLAASLERYRCLLPLLASGFVSLAGIGTGAGALLYGVLNGLFSGRLGTVVLISGSVVLLALFVYILRHLGELFRLLGCRANL